MWEEENIIINGRQSVIFAYGKVILQKLESELNGILVFVSKPFKSVNKKSAVYKKN